MVNMRNPRLKAEKTRVDTTSGAGPSSYDSADRPTLTLSNLRNIDSINDVVMQTQGNAVYLAIPVSVSGNVVTYMVAEGKSGANAEVADTTDVSAVTFQVMAYGQ